MADRANSPHGGSRIAIGAGLVACSGLLLVRAAGPWPGDAIVWPAAVAAAGALLVSRTPHAQPRRRPGWAAHPPVERPARVPSARLRRLGRPEVSRRGLGFALVVAAALAFLSATGATRSAGEVVLTALAVLAAVALTFAPSWRRLARGLAAERAERIRAQERADLAAHLHDSVLQTLALIQRSADDPKRVTALARQRERELRAWMADGSPRHAGDSLGSALEAAVAEVDPVAGGAIELVTVGDCPLGERGVAALVAAAREAMLNAAKFAGEGPISVYAEVSDERIEVFVRDRGAGFDPAAVPAARRGVRESIVGRMQRSGGRAAVRSSPGEGTEVEIALDRRGRP